MSQTSRAAVNSLFLPNGFLQRTPSTLQRQNPTINIDPWEGEYVTSLSLPFI